MRYEKKPVPERASYRPRKESGHNSGKRTGPMSPSKIKELAAKLIAKRALEVSKEGS